MYAGAGEASASQAFYREYILPRMADHQRIILVPGLYGDRNVSRTGSMASQEAAVLHKLETFWAWARDDRRVVGLVPWHWQSASLGAFGLGSSIVGTDVELGKSNDEGLVSADKDKSSKLGAWQQVSKCSREWSPG